MDVNWLVDSPFDQLPAGDPDATALLVDAVEGMTYRELQQRRDEFVAILCDAGVRSGDRVGMLLVNALDYVALYFAIARVGAVAVRLNFRLQSQELQYIIDDAGCAVVFVHTSRLPQVEPIRDAVQVERWYSLADEEGLAPEWAPLAESAPAVDVDALPRPAGSDPLMLMYTSGTTGRPKGVVWTHEGSLWLANAQAIKWGFTSRTVALTTGPLYHAGAFEVLLLPALLVHGTAVTMSSGGMTTPRIVDAVERARATHVMLYPFLLYGILREGVAPERLASLEVILAGGDAVLPWALQAVDARLPDVQLQQGYGLTEAAMVTCLDHEDRLDHPDSIGRPMPLVSIRVTDADGVPVRSGEVGEICIRAPWMTTGYWRRPEATAEALVEGWFHTGDLGRVTEDGFLVITGRAKDMIRSGGENVYPAEVEAVLATHPDVSAVAIVAVPDARFLEVGCAVVVRAAREPARTYEEVEQDLRALARENLAAYKGPKHYVFVDELPINATGKVQKHLLRDEYRRLGSSVVALS